MLGDLNYVIRLTLGAFIGPFHYGENMQNTYAYWRLINIYIDI